MKWYIYTFLGVTIFLIFIIVLVTSIRTKKRIYEKLLDSQIRCGTKQFEIIEAKKKEYDYVLKCKNVNIYIKCISVQQNSQICINAKETWQLNFGGNKNNYGRVYPYKAYLNELTHYLKNDITGDPKALKTILVYPNVESIVRYLNESELDTIDIKKTPHGYKVLRYATLKEDLNYILKEYNDEK